MDITNLLSLMAQGKNADIPTLLSSLSGTQKSTEMKNGAMDMISMLASGKGLDAQTIMSLYGNRKSPAEHLKPISKFASDEIMGILSKYFL